MEDGHSSSSCITAEAERKGETVIVTSLNGIDDYSSLLARSPANVEVGIQTKMRSRSNQMTSYLGLLS